MSPWQWILPLQSYPSAARPQTHSAKCSLVLCSRPSNSIVMILFVPKQNFSVLMLSDLMKGGEDRWEQDRPVRHWPLVDNGVPSEVSEQSSPHWGPDFDTEGLYRLPISSSWQLPSLESDSGTDCQCDRTLQGGNESPLGLSVPSGFYRCLKLSVNWSYWSCEGEAGS